MVHSFGSRGMSARSRTMAALLALAVCMTSFVVSDRDVAQAASEDKVLILAGTVSGGASSIEASQATANGLAVDLVDGATWSTMSATDFASYRAIILGDPTCQGISPDIEAATRNATTWGSVVNGNVLINGTDPVYHASQGGDALTRRSIDFAVAQTGKTGVYISLSCYYHNTGPATPVPLLDGIAGGGFTVSGVGCYNNAHIVAEHVALTGLTGAALSNWSCSVHEAFGTWPGSLIPLAIARDFDSSFTASDGSQGPPYILAGGDIRSFPLSLAPLNDSAPAGNAHIVTATLLDGSTRAPVIGAKIGFVITTGPNSGATGACDSYCLTGVDGTVAWAYQSNGVVGRDTILAYYDRNSNGLADPGEPLTTAGMVWTIAARPELNVVVLGDSFASGHGAGAYGTSGKCKRSSLAWSRQLDARSPQLKVVGFFACSGAVIDNLTSQYKHGEPPQIAQLKNLIAGGTRVDVVMFGIGGNDFGLSSVLGDCFLKDCSNGRLMNPWPRLNSIQTRITSEVIPAIRLAAPGARVVAVGYPRLFPDLQSELTGCGWLEPLEWQLAKGANAGLANRIRWAAEDTGSIYGDAYNALDGYELCSGSGSHVNPLITAVSDSAHPNALGYLDYAKALESSLITSGLITD